MNVLRRVGGLELSRIGDGLRGGLELVRGAAPVLAFAVPAVQLLVAVLPLAALLVLQRLVDAASALGSGAGPASATSRTAITWAVALGLLGLVTATVQLASSYLSELQGQRLNAWLQDRIHAKSVDLDLAFFENPLFHDELHRAQTQGLRRPAAIAGRMARTLDASFSLVGTVALLAAVDWVPLTLVVVASIPGYRAGLSHARRAHRWDRSRAPIQRTANFLSSILTAARYAKEVRVYGLGRRLRKRCRALRDRLLEGDLAISRKRLTVDLWTQSLTLLALIAGLIWILFQTAAGVLTIGTLVMYYAALRRLAGAARQLRGGATGLYEDGLFLADLVEFLELEPDVREAPDPVAPGPPSRGIVVEGVTFRYPGTDADVLRDVELRIGAGEIVALVGPNGSGKTTLVKLLLRLYDPAAGRILCDGLDLRQLELRSYRRLFAVAFQDFARFPLSLRTAVGYGDAARLEDDEAIRRALRRVDAEALVTSLHDGLDTPLVRWLEGGAELSAGQWQRLALARAFFADAPVLILDEPTASLDPLIEADLFGQVRRLLEERTALVISHRLANVRDADRIYVLDGGRVVESGAHDDLVSRDGLYARMYLRQSAMYGRPGLELMERDKGRGGSAIR